MSRPCLLALALASAATVASAATGPLLYQSNARESRFGWAVAFAGDVNGDGRKDLVVGAPGYTNGEAGEGAVFLFLGSASLTTLSPAYIYESNQAGAGLGSSVCAAGDVNLDGYADILVGAPGWDGTLADEGRALILLGSSLSGTSTGLTVGWSRLGDQVGAHFGAAVASSVPPIPTPVPHDGITYRQSFNGDGYPDIVVASPEEAAGEAEEGRVRMFLGAAGGPSSSASWTSDGNQVGAHWGSVVACAGWVNEDGLPDLAIGSQYYDGTQAEQGRVQVFHGSTTTGLASSASFTKLGDGQWSFFGSSLAPAGDTNADGWSDLLVGTSNYLPAAAPQAELGRAYLFKGSTSGLSTTAAWTRIAPATDTAHASSVATAGLFNADTKTDVAVGAAQNDTERGRIEMFYEGTTSMPTTPTWTWSPANTTAMAGLSSAGAGDLNGDGRWELAVGAPGFEDGEHQEGAIYVFIGGVTPPSNPTGD